MMNFTDFGQNLENLEIYVMIENHLDYVIYGVIGVGPPVIAEFSNVVLLTLVIVGIIELFGDFLSLFVLIIVLVVHFSR